MKKLLLTLLAISLLFSLAACGKKTEPTDGTKDDSQGGQTEQAMIPGTLNPINVKEGEKPALKGLRLVGNRAGSGDAGGFNDKPYAAEGIRCIFELDEWVEIYPELEKTGSVSLWVFTHREDQSSYEKLTFSDALQGLVTFVDLNKPESKDDTWGSFYLNPADVKEGYYDLVFTVDGKAAASVLTRFYKPEELIEKSDAELQKIQNGLEPMKVK